MNQEQIEQRIVTLEAEREEYIQQVNGEINRVIGHYNGRIDELRLLLQQLQQPDGAVSELKAVEQEG